MNYPKILGGRGFLYWLPPSGSRVGHGRVAGNRGSRDKHEKHENQKWLQLATEFFDDDDDDNDDENDDDKDDDYDNDDDDNDDDHNDNHDDNDDVCQSVSMHQ